VSGQPDDDELTPEEANYAALTEIEHKAIQALQRLAKRWPQTLKLVSMGGGLHVIRNGDPRFGESSGVDRGKAVIDSIIGIPNDGGDW
jgi:diaminopimelate decarboxylase